MGNTIEHTMRPITYGPHMMKNLRAEQAISFLEDPNNSDKPVPKDLLLKDEIIWLQQYGRIACAQYIREGLQGGNIGG